MGLYFTLVICRAPRKVRCVFSVLRTWRTCARRKYTGIPVMSANQPRPERGKNKESMPLARSFHKHPANCALLAMLGCLFLAAGHCSYTSVVALSQTVWKVAFQRHPSAGLGPLNPPDRRITAALTSPAVLQSLFAHASVRLPTVIPLLFAVPTFDHMQ